ILFAKSNQGVEYEALDGQPVYLFFMIAVPDGTNDTHLQTLAALSKLLIDERFVEQLKQVTTHDEVHALFDQKEKDERAEKESTDKTVDDAENACVVVVTVCPRGIAQTLLP